MKNHNKSDLIEFFESPIDWPMMSVNFIHACKFLCIAYVKQLIPIIEYEPELFSQNKQDIISGNKKILFASESCSEIRTLFLKQGIQLDLFLIPPKNVLKIFYEEYPQYKK